MSDHGEREHDAGRPEMEWDHTCDGSYKQRCEECEEYFDENETVCPWCGHTRPTTTEATP